MQTALRFLLFSLLMSMLAFSAKAQTTYYTNTINELQSEYGITGGTWAWPANEMTAFSAAGGWGANIYLSKYLRAAVHPVRARSGSGSAGISLGQRLEKQQPDRFGCRRPLAGGHLGAR